MRGFALILAILATFSIPAIGQIDDPINIETSVVRLNVGVADRQGRPITDLDRSVFTVYEDGVKQQIVGFEPSTAPFSVVLMLDMSGSTLPFRQVLKQAANRFVYALGPDDRVAVVEFYDRVNLRNDFTTNGKVILHSIDASNGRGKTRLFDAIDFALDKLAREKGRRKAIIVLSDGVDSLAQSADRDQLANMPDSKVPNGIAPDDYRPMADVLRKSDKFGVSIYPLALPTGDPAKLADPTARQIEMFRAARERFAFIAQRTGATIRTINRLEDMGRLYAEVAADLRTLYTIDYQPLNYKRDGKWHAIKVEVTNPELISRTRTGYFAR
ncbi:MAG TPA: VWA domain-containing protein [Pyrinomonadaceae bacterium]|nr:VWA domain-containing protein [Pyrinomonadaceae bacterium]